MTDILIVEDNKELAELLRDFLRAAGYSTAIAENGEKALLLFGQYGAKVVILDIMLAGIDGFAVCKKIREESNTPILIVSAKTEKDDKLNGLILGADDYITKPFLPLELVARVKAQLRRYKRYNQDTNQENDILVHSGLVLNMKSHECTLNEKPLSLTPIEFSILRILCEQKGTVVSSEELFHQIWGDEYFNKNNNTITVHIRHLREKMGDSFEEPKYIKTVWGCGYKIEK